MVYIEPKAQVSFFDQILNSSNDWESAIDPDGV